jgi:molecular chaperone GrpE
MEKLMTEGIDQQAELAGARGPLDPRAEVEAAAAGETEGEASNDVAMLREQLAQAREDAAGNREKHLRALADMENYKKRIARTYAELARTNKKALLTKLLAVKDNLERALQYGDSAGGGGEGIIEGVRLTQYQLDQLLVNEGVRPIEALGQSFDPNLEEAIQRVNDIARPDHEVVQVVRTGYVFSETGEVLRPAQVVVNVHSDEEDRA